MPNLTALGTHIGSDVFVYDQGETSKGAKSRGGKEEGVNVYISVNLFKF